VGASLGLHAAGFGHYLIGGRSGVEGVEGWRGGGGRRGVLLLQK